MAERVPLRPLDASTYRLLRVTTNLSDDTDWVGAQTAIADIPYITVRRPEHGGAGSGGPVKVEVMLEWLDASNVVAAPGASTFSITPIRIMARETHAPSELSGNAVIDGATLTSQEAHRPIIIDEVMPGDRFTVRLTSMVQASAAKARVLYREIH